jgi:hypothetical protein
VTPAAQALVLDDLLSREAGPGFGPRWSLPGCGLKPAAVDRDGNPRLIFDILEGHLWNIDGTTNGYLAGPW